MSNNKHIESQMNSLIPKGFLSVQLRRQWPRQQIWPKMNWTEVTRIYVRLFFGAEGGQSAKYRQVQLESFLRIKETSVECLDRNILMETHPWRDICHEVDYRGNVKLKMSFHFKYCS